MFRVYIDLTHLWSYQSRNAQRQIYAAQPNGIASFFVVHLAPMYVYDTFPSLPKRLFLLPDMLRPSSSPPFPFLPYTALPSLPTPANLSNPPATYGPTTGTPLTNPATVPKKSPNNTNIPYNSTINPMNAQRMSISVMPTAKASVPRHFWRRAKNERVFWVPIRRVRPIRNRI